MIVVYKLLANRLCTRRVTLVGDSKWMTANDPMEKRWITA